MITCLAGGVGAARLLVGMQEAYDRDEINVIVNTGDDTEMFGLTICPDIDTIIYTLSGNSNAKTGWGLKDETWNVLERLDQLGGSTWFSLGDKDLATHLFRTELLTQGQTLSQVTQLLASRFGLKVKILPMSDDRVRTLLRVDPFEVQKQLGENFSTFLKGDYISFQEYFVRLKHSIAIKSVRFDGAQMARPAPGVLGTLKHSSTIVICPSNPIVSIGPILAISPIVDILKANRHKTVAISPIVNGTALKGPADRMMIELGHEPSVVGVARIYREYCDTLIIDNSDRRYISQVEELGMRCLATDTIMSSLDKSVELCNYLLKNAITE